VTLQGRDTEVECDARDGKVYAIVEGRRLDADFVRLPDGEVYSLLVDGHSHEVRVSHHGDGLDVTANGLTIPVEVRNPLEKLLSQQVGSRAKSRGETLSAPMPGVVVTLRVKVGELVQPGQPVVVVEAMKMQNELTAQTGGVVSEILVTERAAVAAGQALVKMKPAESPS
jgi:biotin carboxyl carrier protein